MTAIQRGRDNLERSELWSIVSYEKIPSPEQDKEYIYERPGCYQTREVGKYGVGMITGPVKFSFKEYDDIFVCAKDFSASGGTCLAGSRGKGFKLTKKVFGLYLTGVFGPGNDLNPIIPINAPERPPVRPSPSDLASQNKQSSHHRR